MKLLRILGIALLILCFSLPVLAASNMDFYVKERSSTAHVEWIQVTVEVTAHTDGTITTEQLLDDDDATGGNPLKLWGMYLWHVTYLYGGTAPTDNSDLVINEGSATGNDILGGVGLNVIDAATNHYFQPKLHDDGTSYQYGGKPIYDYLYIGVSNNSANGATFTLILDFIR